MTDESTDNLPIDRDSEPGSYARHLRHTKDMPMGKMSRDKGAGFERETVNLFRQKFDLIAYRVPLSGATDFQKGDVTVEPIWKEDGPYVGECKRRKSLPKIFEELGEHDFLTLRADRGESLTVIRTELFAELLQ